MSTRAIDALDRARTAVFLPVSPLEQHGPHLPVGVDALAARHAAEVLAERLVERRPGWAAVLVPTLHLGSFTFDAPGTISVRQRVVRDAVIDYGASLARAGFRYILVTNGHGGPGHLNALEEAAARVSRRHRVMMASFTGHLAWQFLRGRYLPRIEAALGRALDASERRALADDAHGGWWETSLMLLLRPDLVDDAYRMLPPARYSLPRRVRRNYPLRGGGQGYVGHPSMADPIFAKAVAEVLVVEALDTVEGLIDGTIAPRERRSPFFRVPFLRTGFWRATGLTAVGLSVVALAAAGLARGRPGRRERVVDDDTLATEPHG